MKTNSIIGTFYLTDDITKQTQVILHGNSSEIDEVQLTIQMQQVCAWGSVCEVQVEIDDVYLMKCNCMLD